VVNDLIQEQGKYARGDSQSGNAVRKEGEGRAGLLVCGSFRHNW
jgi:hypothetical protein